MNTALSIFHGSFGRAGLYALDQPIKTHVHREGHLNFYVEGPGAFTVVRDKMFAMNSKHACAINPCQPHSFHPGKSEQRSIFLILYIDPYWALQKCGTDIFLLQFGTTQIAMSKKIAQMVSMIVKLMLDKNSVNRELLEEQLQSLTKTSSRQSFFKDLKSNQMAADKKTRLDRRIRKSMKLMAEGDLKTISIDEIARQSGLSRPHFYSLFRKSTGFTPSVYMDLVKVERSIEYLTTTELKLYEIGDRVGFESQSAFSKFFASHVGMAPIKYRNATQVLGEH